MNKKLLLFIVLIISIVATLKAQDDPFHPYNLLKLTDLSPQQVKDLLGEPGYELEYEMAQVSFVEMSYPDHGVYLTGSELGGELRITHITLYDKGKEMHSVTNVKYSASKYLMNSNEEFLQTYYPDAEKVPGSVLRSRSSERNTVIEYHSGAEHMVVLWLQQ